MRVGLLADIHEEVENLERAIEALRSEGIRRFLVLGDVFETGRRIEETVAMLAPLDAAGVWGNHDFGLCGAVDDEVRARFSPEVLAYFAGLRPWVEWEGCRAQHIEPFLDAGSIEDLWSYGGEGRLDAERSFASRPHRRFFMGHLHRWVLATPEAILPWDGSGPVRLADEHRYLIAVHAVQQGWCAWYDRESGWLVPFRLT